MSEEHQKLKERYAAALEHIEKIEADRHRLRAGMLKAHRDLLALIDTIENKVENTMEWVEAVDAAKQ